MSQTETGKTQVSRRTLAKGGPPGPCPSSPPPPQRRASASAACTPGAAKSYSTADADLHMRDRRGCQAHPQPRLRRVERDHHHVVAVDHRPQLPAAGLDDHRSRRHVHDCQLGDVDHRRNPDLVRHLGSLLLGRRRERRRDRTGDLTVTGAPIAVVSGEAITTDATGAGAGEVAPASGNVVITVGDFTVALVTNSTSFPDQNVVCTLDAGQDATLATIPISA